MARCSIAADKAGAGRDSQPHPAMARAAELGLGVALLAVSDALPYLERGALVRLLPRWCADLGSISIYYPGKTLLPGKTRVFIDHVAEAFRRERLAQRFTGSLV